MSKEAFSGARVKLLNAKNILIADVEGTRGTLTYSRTVYRLLRNLNASNSQYIIMHCTTYCMLVQHQSETTLLPECLLSVLWSSGLDFS